MMRDDARLMNPMNPVWISTRSKIGFRCGLAPHVICMGPASKGSQDIARIE